MASTIYTIQSTQTIQGGDDNTIDSVMIKNKKTKQNNNNNFKIQQLGLKKKKPLRGIVVLPDRALELPAHLLQVT